MASGVRVCGLRSLLRRFRYNPGSTSRSTSVPVNSMVWGKSLRASRHPGVSCTMLNRESPRLTFPNEFPSRPVTIRSGRGTPPSGLAVNATAVFACNARRPVGPAYSGMGGGVFPNVTKPRETLFTVRLVFFCFVKPRYIRAFTRINAAVTAAMFSC